jgi:hypothetical protein
MCVFLCVKNLLTQYYYLFPLRAELGFESPFHNMGTIKKKGQHLFLHLKSDTINPTNYQVFFFYNMSKNLKKFLNY